MTVMYRVWCGHHGIVRECEVMENAIEKFKEHKRCGVVNITKITSCIVMMHAPKIVVEEAVE